MQRGCPGCFGIDFAITSTVITCGGITLLDDGTPHYHDDEDIMWDTLQVDWVECHSCGWGAEVNRHSPLEELFAPLFDPAIEDLPDEEDIEKVSNESV